MKWSFKLCSWVLVTLYAPPIQDTVVQQIEISLLIYLKSTLVTVALWLIIIIIIITHSSLYTKIDIILTLLLIFYSSTINIGDNFSFT